MPGKQDWCTPQEIWEPAQILFGGQIDLDPFFGPDSNVPATRWFTEDDDGLVQPWDGKVFVNGPWSLTKAVVEKCEREWSWGCDIVAVIPTSLNSSYWHIVERAPAVCVPKRRVSFEVDGEPHKGNRQDCVVVYWGADTYRFRALFSELGRVRFG